MPSLRFSRTTALIHAGRIFQYVIYWRADEPFGRSAWFRLFGRGLFFRTLKHGLLFSERSGYKKFLTVGPLAISYLPKDKR